MPAIGAFHDPSSRLLSANGSCERWFAASTNVRLDSAGPRFPLGFVVVVAFVETNILGTPRSARSAELHGIQGLAYHVHVVDVGAAQRDRQRNALTVYEDVAFGAEFRAIGRIRTRELPPLGALTLALSRDAHSHSIPTLSS